jgi:serine/threonine-protein phosphatase 6 regulatory ankyrin repeat subunit B
LRDTHGRHSLFHAIEKGLPEMAAFLIKYGADVRKAHACGDNGGKLVHYVPDEKYASLMRLLHREGADINVQDESGDTPLHLACAEGNEAKIRTLLALSADPNIVNEFGRRPLDTLLDYAHTRDDFLLVRLLLDAGADSGTSPSTLMRQSPLHIAARYNRKETMLALLQRNVTVDDTDSEGVTPYMTAIESGHLDIARMLELRGADPSRKDVRHQTLFHLAAENGDKDVMAYVLQLRSSTDINARNAKGETALHLACKKDRGAAAQILLGNGADPFLFDAEGHTPLHRATLGGNTRLINLIEEKAGKPIDWNLMTAETKESPLHLAIKGRAPNMLSLLLSKGANPLVRNRNGVTALHYAIVLDHTNMAAELLDCMIERQEHPDTLRDRNGWTFLHYAATRNTHDLSARLISAGAQIDSRNTAGETPLHLAVRAGQMQNVKYLVEERLASLDIRDDNGNTPLDAALKIGREDVAQFLIRAATARHAAPLPAQQNKRGGHRI